MFQKHSAAVCLSANDLSTLYKAQILMQNQLALLLDNVMDYVHLNFRLATSLLYQLKKSQNWGIPLVIVILRVSRKPDLIVSFNKERTVCEIHQH